MLRAAGSSDTRRMVSVPDWTSDGYRFQRERRFSVQALVLAVKDSLHQFKRRSQPAPAAPKSLVYALCEEYQTLDLWAAYHAFRLDPRARTWQRLRRRSVPWQKEQTVEGLLHRLCPIAGKRTPDPNTVGLALVSAAAISRKKKR